MRDRTRHDRRRAIEANELRRQLGWEPSRTDFERRYDGDVSKCYG